MDKKERKSKRGKMRENFDTALTLLLLVVSMLMIYGRYFHFTPYDVLGESMMPTLESGDRLLMKDKVEIKKGNIVVLDSPLNEDELYIKRVIATAGDTVEISKGKVSVNGEQLDEKWYGETVVNGTDGKGLREEKIVIPEGEVFVLGDNRENSLDSRVFGTVKEESIRGEMWCRILPLSRIGCE